MKTKTKQFIQHLSHDIEDEERAEQYLDEFNELVGELAEVGKLRNLVVHADWSNTDEEGYTFVRLKTSSNGMLQEYVQFSVESLEKLIERLIKANHQLSDYWEWKSDRLQDHFRGAS